MPPIAEPPPLAPELRDRVLDRLGVAHPPAPDLDALRALYRAWGERVPFDNVRKMIALRTDAPLPGKQPAEFLARWLADGCGGTCWATSGALHALLRSLGFDARRVAGSMRDAGVVNHGSVVVAIDGRDWLVDAAVPTGDPLPLGVGPHDNAAPVLRAEVEPDGDTHVVWFHVPPHEDGYPCRLLVDPVDDAFRTARYEDSRASSPFNEHLYARRNLPHAMLVLRGATRFLKTADGVARRELSRDALCDALRDEIGLSRALVDAWVACGGLDATYEQHRGPPPPPLTGRAPSRRD